MANAIEEMKQELSTAIENVRTAMHWIDIGADKKADPDERRMAPRNVVEDLEDAEQKIGNVLRVMRVVEKQGR